MSEDGSLLPPPAAVFSHQLTVRKRIVGATASQVHQRCLRTFRHDNLGLLFFLTPPPFVLDFGDETTGVGFVMMRFPPWFLKEGIVDYQQYPQTSDETTTKLPPTRVEFRYKVLNPGYFTWPVCCHSGTIEIRQQQQQEPHEQNVSKALGTNSEMVVCDLSWKIQWTPLWLPIPFWYRIMGWIHQFIMERATSHIAAIGNSSKKNQ